VEDAVVQSFEIDFVTTRLRNCVKSSVNWRRRLRTVGFSSSSCVRRSDAAISWSRREPTTRKRFNEKLSLITYHVIPTYSGCFLT